MTDIEIKFGDKRVVNFYTNLDLTGATGIEIKARPIGGATVVLAHEVVNLALGQVRHVTDGTLPIGLYSAVLRATLSDGRPVTAPSDDSYVEFEIVPNID